MFLFFFGNYLFKKKFDTKRSEAKTMESHNNNLSDVVPYPYLVLNGKGDEPRNSLKRRLVKLATEWNNDLGFYYLLVLFTTSPYHS